MIRTLPSYEQCNQIVKLNPSFVRKEEIIGNTRIVQFNYFLASYQDFAKEYFPSVDAFELRGLTFIQRENGTWQRQLMLQKFFNINQSQGWLEDDLRKKKIVRVQNKFDGSLIRFVRLNDGTVVAKTKFSFTGEQAIAANKLYQENEDLRHFVNMTLDVGEAALFEYVSPFNRIVLQYSVSELVLLQVRKEQTGEYLDVSQFESCGFSIASEEQKIESLDDYIDWAKTAVDVEGKVLQFDDGMFAKCKTAQYFHLHHIVTESSKRENDLVAAVLSDNVDDLIAQIPIEQTEVRDKIDRIAKLITDYINKEAERCYWIVECEYKNDRRRFAIVHKRDKLFGILMKLVDQNSQEHAIELLKQFVAKQTRTLDAARVFLATLERKSEKQ